MKILVDVSAGRAVTEWLKAQGHDVLAVSEIDPGLPDDEILRRAVSDQRLVITMDKDFGELVYNSSQDHAGVLLLRLEDQRGSEKVRVLEWIFSKHADELPGKFSVYKKDRLRVR